MIDFLYRIDCSILLWIHQQWRCSIGDIVFGWLHESEHFVIPLALVWLYLMVFGGRRGRVLGLLLAVGLLLTDQISSQVLKPLVGRVRPCFTVDGVTAIVHQVHSNSFPSGHATNNFGAATIFFLARGGRWVWLMPLAAIIAISRVYLGVHYPSDVLVGALLGIAIGCLVVYPARHIPFLQRSLNSNDISNQDQQSGDDNLVKRLLRRIGKKE